MNIDNKDPAVNADRMLAVMAKWRRSWWQRVAIIINAYNLAIRDVPEFFLFRNLKQENEKIRQIFSALGVKPNWLCPLFAGPEPCHYKFSEIPHQEFCCLFCYCPKFLIEANNGNGRIKKIGICGAGAEEGVLGYYTKNILDCTSCDFMHNIGWARVNMVIALKEIRSADALVIEEGLKWAA